MVGMIQLIEKHRPLIEKERAAFFYRRAAMHYFVATAGGNHAG
jgi:hypothetical protein